MSGFTATADPAHSDGFRVTRVVIADPWYPDVSSIWGASRPPGSRLPVAALARDYLPYDRPGRRHPKRDGKFLLILPSLPAGVQVRWRGSLLRLDRSWATPRPDPAAGMPN
jgi:hypothetical protein